MLRLQFSCRSVTTACKPLFILNNSPEFESQDLPQSYTCSALAGLYYNQSQHQLIPLFISYFGLFVMISNDARDFVAGKVKQAYRNSNSIHIFFNKFGTYVPSVSITERLQ